MSSALKVSEAASLGLHAMAFLAANPGKPVAAGRIAERLRASEAHLAKVLQRLSKAGLVRSARGPGGGFSLARRREDIALLEVYEAIEGPLREGKCLFGRPVCGGKQCILGKLVETVNTRVRGHLERTKLSSLTHVLGEER
jgi:Rrf2 family protein